MDEDLSMLIIISVLLILLGVAVWLNQDSEAKKLIAELAKISISGYLGYISGKNIK